MRLCFECMNKNAEGEQLKRWHFKTVEGPCEQCGNTFAHRREYGL